MCDMMPNEFGPGCMLNSLVCNGKVSEAVTASIQCSLIKASSMLERGTKCRGYWQNMVQERAMMPN